MRRFLIALTLAGVLCQLPSRAHRIIPPSDPNSSADWNWTTKERHALFYQRPGQAPGRIQVELPFFCPGNRLHQTPGDRWQEDGWLLAHRDFGTEQAAPAMPYFTLYNKYRGIFRVMVCNAALAEDARVAGILQLHPDRRQDGQAAPLFTFSHGGGRCFRTDYDRGQAEVAFSPMARVQGWAVFDFQVAGYDPDLHHKDPLLSFTLRRLEPAGGGPKDALDACFAAAPGELGTVLQAGGSGSRSYPTARAWVEQETARTDRGGAPLEWAFRLAATEAPRSCAPLVSTLGGRVERWLGGTHAACPWEPISWSGQASTPIQHGLAGRDLLSLAFYLHPGGQDPRGHRPVQALPWGLFNFEAAPVLSHRQEGEGRRQVLLAEAPRLHFNPGADLELLTVDFQADVSSGEPGTEGVLWPISTEKGPILSGHDHVAGLIATLRYRNCAGTRDYTAVRRLPCREGGLNIQPATDGAPSGPSAPAAPPNSAPVASVAAVAAAPHPRQAAAGSKLLLVSNRIPWTVAVAGGVGTLKPSPGGLATALSRTHEQAGTLWVGWPGDLTGLAGPERGRILDELHGQRVAPVELSAVEVERFYEGYSNGVLWPLFHALQDKVTPGRDRDWEAYVAVNGRFAQAAAAQAAPGDTVWIHDYQLMLVPRMLRELRPEVRIGFFLHIPFPPAEIFEFLPSRKALLQDVLGADLVGFQTPEHQAHFAEAARRILGADPGAAGLRHQGREIRLGTYPIGIDAAVYAQTAASPAAVERAARIRGDLGGRTLVLGVDRLDYTKGIIQRLLAFELHLQRHPEQHGSLVLIQVAVPSREGVPAYRKYRRQVDEIVARINGTCGTPGWMPIHVLHKNLPCSEVVALYRAADVILVTPLRDGMNLVAKEFCAAREDESGVLVLSQYAGAALDLPQALLVNPYDTDALADALDTALRMPKDQARERMRALREQVAVHDVYAWSREFLQDLGAGAAPGSARPALPPWARADLPALVRVAEAQRVVLFLDYDGTLVPLALRPGDAAPDPALLGLLRRLGETRGLEVHLVSGRPRETLEAWFGRLPLRLHAEHGLWRKHGPDAPWTARIKRDNGWKREAGEVMEAWCRQHEGTSVEEKSHSLACHYRQARRQPQAGEWAALRESLRPLAQAEDLEWLGGSKVLELRLRGVHKGLAVEGVALPPGTLAVAVGDDRTDEDLFRALPLGSLTVKVGEGATEACDWLCSPLEVRSFLEALWAEFAVRQGSAAVPLP
jgi:trehalose 6-phosphate synthase/phosphatase